MRASWGAGSGDRVGDAGVPVPRRFSPVHRQRGLPAQLDVVHRPTRGWLGGRVVRLARGDR